MSSSSSSRFVCRPIGSPSTADARTSPTLDAGRERRRPERHDLGDLAAGRELRTRARSNRRPSRPTAGAAAAGRRRADAHMRRVQLADHQVEEPAHFIRRPRAGDARAYAARDGVPVHAVELLVVEPVAQEVQACRKTSHLLLREVDVELRGHGERPRLARLDRARPDAALLEVDRPRGCRARTARRLSRRASTSTAARPAGSRDSSSSDQMYRFCLPGRARRSPRRLAVRADR